MIRYLFIAVRRRLREEVAGWRHYFRMMRVIDEARRRQARRLLDALDTVPSPWWRRRRRWHRIRPFVELALIGTIAVLIALSFLVQPRPLVKVNPRLNPEARPQSPTPRSP